MFQTTRLSKTFVSLLLIVFVVQQLRPDTSSYLALVPGRTLPCVWNLITSAFVTPNAIELAVNVVALLILARLVEPVYGSKEFLKFLFIVNLVTCCTIFVAVYIAFAISALDKLLFTEFSGFHGLNAAMLVAVKQIMPHHELKLFGIVRAHVKYLPSLVMLPVIAVTVSLGYLKYLAFYTVGTYVAWLYLRFFQTQPETGALGDASDDFKASSFFPAILAPVIDALASVLGFITRLRHVPGNENSPVIKGLHMQAGGSSALGSDSVDANRRRERGAKALEERLGQKAAVPVAASSPVITASDMEAGEPAA
ncbi:eukaryotic integral membrane protein-domain-containing protein [Haematococcus lacustris]